MRKVVLCLVAGLLVFGCAMLLYVPIVPVTGTYFEEALTDEILAGMEYIASSPEEMEAEVLSVEFSHNEYLYSSAIDVTLQASNPEATIYYTTNSSEPTSESDVYSLPIRIEEKENACTVLKAVAVLHGNMSPVATHSYFVHSGIESRFSTMVFSLSTDEDNLYSYENGIFYDGGPEYDAALEEEDYTLKNRYSKGREWEREVCVEVFEDGQPVLTQNAGLRVHGNASRKYPQTSLRLVARKEYDAGHGKFDYEFFPDSSSQDGYGTALTRYDSLILHSGGNEWENSKIITQLLTGIAADAGFPATAPFRQVAVFLNGEYYGFAWLMPRIDDDYLQQIYSAPDNEFPLYDYSYIIEELTKRGSEAADDEEDEFMLAVRELTQTEVFSEGDYKRLAASFDIEDLLFYFAVETYVGNGDWLRNNVRLWRYAGDTERTEGMAGLDGKARYILYDLDVSMNFPGEVDVALRSHADYDLLDRALKDNKFSKVMDVEEWRNSYANYICDLALNHYSLGNIDAWIGQLLSGSMQEIEVAMQEMDKQYFGEKGSMQERFDARFKNIREFAVERPAFMFDVLYERYGYDEMYTIKANGPVKINTSTGQGSYFVECEVPVTHTLAPGETFRHWLVNGQVRTEETLAITAADAIDGVVSVELEYEPYSGFSIENCYDNGSVCGFTLVNNSGSVLSTEGLYLSDRAYELEKYALPTMRVSSGTRLDFVGKSNYDQTALLKLALTFNPRSGETIYLSNKDGNILSALAVP